MPRLTTKEVQTFRARVNKLHIHLGEILDLRNVEDAKPKETMLVVSTSVAALASAFDFGDEIRRRIQPGLILHVMKANTPLLVRSARAEAFHIVEQMQQHLLEKLDTIAQEHARGR